MIDYLNIAKGAIRLHQGDKCVALSNSAHYLIDVIREKGGLKLHYMASSTFIEALSGCDESAQEAGFKTADEFRQIWNQVEHVLWKNQELV